MDAANFLARFDSLPKEIQKRILDYAESILGIVHRKENKNNASFKFDWEAGVSKIKDSAVELQHKANEWR